MLKSSIARWLRCGFQSTIPSTPRARLVGRLTRLESREVPAVTASVDTNNVLNVTLSAPSDTAYITASGSGIRVGTTVNGIEALTDTTGIVAISLTDSGANADQVVQFDGSTAFTLTGFGGNSVTSAGIETVKINQAINNTGTITGNATTTFVNSPGEINDALAIVSSGGTIHVAAGNYPEAVSVNKPVTFLGANSGKSAQTATLRLARAAESIIGPATYPANVGFIINANDVTIDGFSFLGAGLNIGEVAQVLVFAKNTILRNTIFNSQLNSPFQPGGQNSIGVVTGIGFNYTGLLIENSFFARQRNGIFLNPSNSVTSVTVQNNGFSSRTGFNSDISNSGYDWSSSFTLALTGNLFSLESVDTGTFGPVNGINIGEVVSGMTVNVGNNTITTNSQGLRLASVLSGGTVNATGNTFSDHTNPAIGLRNLANAGSTVTLMNNKFRNEFYILNEGAASLNLSTGSNSVDLGSGDTAVSGLTNSQLFQVADRVFDAIDNPSRGQVVLKANHVYVTPNSFNNSISPATTTPSIQRAINVAATGDTVHIAAGTTYTGGLDATATSLALTFSIATTSTTTGAVSLTGDIVLDANDTLDFQINGTAATDFDSLTTTNGSATLGGAALVVTGSHTPAFGQSFTIVNAFNGLTGTFAGKPDGFNFLLNLQPLKINYIGTPDFDVVLSFNGAPVVNATSGNDTITVSKSGSDLVLNINGSDVLVTPIASLTSLTVNGLAGNDTMTVDFSGGNPLPSGGITFNGDDPTTGPGDQLAFANGSTSAMTFNYTNASDGSVVFGGAIAGTVNYTGLEPISSTITASTVTLNYLGGTETITVTDAGSGSTTVNSTLGEMTTFANPSVLLTINAGTGDDVVNVNSLASNYAALTINGDGGTDTIKINAALSLGNGVNTGHLDLTAEAIVLAANVNTDAGTNAGNVTLTGPVSLTANVTIDTNGGGTDGNVTFSAAITAAGNNLTVEAGGGNINLAGGSGFATLTLNSDAAVTQSAAIAGTSLLLLGNGTHTLTNAGNDFGTLAANLGGTGTLNYTDTNALTVGTVSVSGITTNDGNVTLTSGPLTINQLINTSGGTGVVSITTTAGGIMSFAAGGVTAKGNIILNSAGTFNQSGGAITNTAGTGDLSITANGDVTIGGAGIATNGNLTINAAGNFSHTGSAIDASGGTGVVSITTTAGGIMSFAAGGVTAKGNIILNSAGTFNQSNNPISNTAGTGNMSITANGDVTIGGAGIATKGNLTINAAGNFSHTGSAIDASGGTGVVSITTTAGGIMSFAAGGVTAKGNIILNSAGTFNQNGNPISNTAGTGDLSITANGDVTIGGAGIATNGNMTINAAGNFSHTSSAIDASGGTGVVSITTTAGGIMSFAAGGVTAKGNIILNSAGTFKQNGNPISNTAGTGNMSITANGDVTIGGAGIATNGNLTINAAGNFSHTSSAIDASGGTGVVSITTTGSGNMSFAAGGVTAKGNIILNSAGTFKQNGNPISNTAGTGNMSITANGDVTIGGAGIATNGNLTINAAGNFSHTGSTINASGGTGVVSITTTGSGNMSFAAGGVTAKGNIILNSAGTFNQSNNPISNTAGTGNMSITANGDVTISAGGVLSTGSVTATTSAGSISLSDNGINTTGNATVTATNAVTATDALGSDITAGTLLLIAGAGGVGTSTFPLRTTVTTLDVSTGGTGAVYVTDTAGGLILNDLNSTVASYIGGVIRANSPLTISSTQIVSGAMDFVAGNGSVDGDDDLTIAADVISDGTGLLRFLAGDDILHTAGHVSVGGTGTVHFLANQDGTAGTDTVVGGITRSGTTSLTAPNAYFSSGSDVSYGGGTNNVGTLAADVTGSTNTFTFTNGSNALTVGTVSVSGITTNNGNVTLTSGALTINKTIAAGTAIVDITAAGATQGASGNITAGSLRVQGTGTFTLSNTSNNVDKLAADVTGSITYVDVDAVAIDAVGSTNGIATNGGSVTVNATAITVNQPISTAPGSGGTLTIGGGVTVNAAITVGAGNVTLNSGGAGDVVIAANLSIAAPVVFNPERDILISAQLKTTGAGNGITLTADSDGDGVGGLWVFGANGEVISAAGVTGSGSGMFKLSNGNSVVLDSGGPGTRISATTFVSLSSNAAAPAGADIYIAGGVSAGTSVSVDGKDVTFLQDAVTAGTSFVTFGDAVNLTGDATVTSSGAGLVSFLQTIDGGFNLTVTSSTGGTTFTGKIGDTTALTSLGVTGPAAINGGLVKTTGTQSFSAAVTLGANTDFTASTVTFNGTVSSSNKSLTTTGSTQANINGGSVNTGTAAQTYNGVVTIATNNLSLTASTVTFNDAVSSATNKNLTTTGTTQANINGGSVNTGTGAQTYNGAVVIAVNDATLTASTVTFNGNVSSATAKDLTIIGNAVFGDAAGDSLTGIDVLSVSGNSTITAGTMTTLDSQTYSGTTQINSTTTYAYTALLFNGNVTGPGSIVFSPPSGTATATFNGASSTYAGTTTVNKGTMTVNSGKTIADGGAADGITLAGVSTKLNGGGTVTGRNILVNSAANGSFIQNLTISKGTGSGIGIVVNADSVTIGGSDTTFANLITDWATGVKVNVGGGAVIAYNGGTGKGVNANAVGIQVSDDGDSILGETRAFLEGNNVNGNSSIGLLVQGGAYVDAGQVKLSPAATRQDFTGLGAVLATTGSSGGNTFNGYTTAVPAIRNESEAGANALTGPQGWPIDVYAQNNTFNGISAATLGASPLPVNYSAIEDVVFHDEDKASFGFVNYASPTTPDFIPSKTRLFNLDPDAADEAANPNQRSMLRGIRLSFNNYFFNVYNNIDLYQTVIVPTGKVTPVATSPTAVNISTASVVDFVPTTGEFRYLVNWGKGPSVEVSGSLQDGRYDLEFNAANIYYGNPLTTLLGGGSFNVTFHRLFGDVNGDGFTSSTITTNPPTWPFVTTYTDKQVFDLVAFGRRRGQPGYLSYLDYDNNGRIDATDRNHFNIRLDVYTTSLRLPGDLPQV